MSTLLRPVSAADLLDRPRQAPRRSALLPAQVRPQGCEDTPWPLDIAEVSETGAFLASDLLLPVGLAVDVAFMVPGRAEPVLARGHIVRVTEARDEAGMGLHFDALSPSARGALRAFTAPR